MMSHKLALVLILFGLFTD